MWGKNEGACVPRWRGETRRGRSAVAGAVARWTSRSVGRRMPQRSSKWAIALWEALAWAERPPLWGSDDVSAMRNYRYRHRDSPYVAKRSGERTSRAGRPWAAGGELPGARWRGRPVCARSGRPCRGSGGTNARVSVFSSTSTLGCGAQGTGGAERRTDQFSVRLF